MRIIITEQGGELLKTLNHEKMLRTLQKNPQQVTTSTKGNMNTYETYYTDKKATSMSTNNLKDILENMRNSKNYKVIEIKAKKLSIPKNIAEKYNEIKLEESSLLPVLHQKLSKISPSKNSNNKNSKIEQDSDSVNLLNTKSANNTDSNDTDPNMKMPVSLMMSAEQENDFLRTSYKMKEIINDDAMVNIKNNIVSGVNMKNRLTNVMQTNFRSPFLTPGAKLVDFEFALDKKIKSDKANIIQYLNSKNCLSPKFIKSLSNYDEDKIERLNKICQKVINEEIRDNDLKIKINGIIDSMHATQQVEYKRQMKLMEREVTGIKKICDKYPKRDNREIYENLLYDIKKKYWDKLNLDKLYKKSNLKTESQ